MIDKTSLTNNCAEIKPNSRRNRILTVAMRSVPYVKELRKLPLVNSTTSCLLMQQLDYWFDIKPEGFYKFLAPAENQPAYKIGDSWEEELGISKDEFRNAFDQIGIRYKSKKEFENAKASGDVFQGRYYCSYTDKIARLTWYFRNNELVNAELDKITFSGEVNSAMLSKPISGDGQWQSLEIDNSNSEYTESTAESTNTDYNNGLKHEYLNITPNVVISNENKFSSDRDVLENFSNSVTRKKDLSLKSGIEVESSETNLGGQGFQTSANSISGVVDLDISEMRFEGIAQKYIQTSGQRSPSNGRAGGRLAASGGRPTIGGGRLILTDRTQDRVQPIYEFWLKATGRDGSHNPLTDEARWAIAARFNNGFTDYQLKLAVLGCLYSLDIRDFYIVRDECGLPRDDVKHPKRKSLQSIFGFADRVSKYLRFANEFGCALADEVDSGYGYQYVDFDFNRDKFYTPDEEFYFRAFDEGETHDSYILRSVESEAEDDEELMREYQKGKEFNQAEDSKIDLLEIRESLSNVEAAAAPQMPPPLVIPFGFNQARLA